MKRIFGTLESALLIIGGVSVMAMLVITVVDIVLRNLANSPVPGVVDLVEFSLAISIFAGIAVVFWRGAHLAVDLLEVVFKRSILRIMADANGVIAVLVNALLAWLCYLRFVDALEWGDATVDLGIPLAWFWVSPLVGFSLGAVFSLVRFVQGSRARMGQA